MNRRNRELDTSKFDTVDKGVAEPDKKDPKNRKTPYSLRLRGINEGYVERYRILRDEHSLISESTFSKYVERLIQRDMDDLERFVLKRKIQNADLWDELNQRELDKRAKAKYVLYTSVSDSDFDQLDDCSIRGLYILCSGRIIQLLDNVNFTVWPEDLNDILLQGDLELLNTKLSLVQKAFVERAVDDVLQRIIFNTLDD